MGLGEKRVYIGMLGWTEIGGRGGRCGIELGKPSVAPWRAVCYELISVGTVIFLLENLCEFLTLVFEFASIFIFQVKINLERLPTY